MEPESKGDEVKGEAAGEPQLKDYMDLMVKEKEERMKGGSQEMMERNSFQQLFGNYGRRNEESSRMIGEQLDNQF